MQIIHEEDAPVFITLIAMNVGDFAFFKGAKMVNMTAAIRYFRKKDNLRNGSKTFTSRTVKDGVKVWRVE